MGNDNSSARPFQAEPYIILDSNVDDMSESPVTNTKLFRRDMIYTSGFNANWTMQLPSSITPPPRTSHFMVYLQELNTAIVGYGIDKNNDLLNDLWALDLNTKMWRQIDFNGKMITPRNGALAVLYNRKIYVFGGFSGKAYLADLHTIDINDFSVTHITSHTSENSPSGRIGHVMAEHNGQILIWGGYNGDWLSDLWIYDISSNTWREIQSDIKGRTSACFTNHKNSLYIFGASKIEPLLRYDWESERLTIVKTTGVSPPAELAAASMVSVDRYVLIFGGKIENNKYGLMYGFDTIRNWWFIFHVMPDGVSTSLLDGSIDPQGNFMVPSISGASIIYRKIERKLMLFLGAPLLEPPNICFIELGDALSILHLQNDMLETLNMNYYLY